MSPINPIRPIPSALRIAALAAALLLAPACSKPPPPPTPEQAAVRSANALLDAVRAADPAAVFEALPPARQNDIRALVAKAVSAIDEELWNESTTFLADFSDAAKKQSANLSALFNERLRASKAPSEAQASPEDFAVLADFLGEIAALDRNALLSGDLSALLSSPSLRSIFSGILGKNAAAHPLPSAFVLLPAPPDASPDAPHGIVSLAAADDPSAPFSVSLHDGVWFPDALDEAIAAACAQASDALDNFTLDPDTRELLLSGLRSVRTLLPSIASAKTPDQLRASALMAFGALSILSTSL